MYGGCIYRPYIYKPYIGMAVCIYRPYIQALSKGEDYIQALDRAPSKGEDYIQALDMALPIDSEIPPGQW
jgi:hypothetical protein